MSAELSFWILLVISPFIGSFLGVLILRFVDGRPLIVARSECEDCRHKLGAAELIPLVSWIWLDRRCKHCGARLSVFYPLIELTAIVPVIWAATEQSGWLLAASALFGWLLIVLGVVDFKSHRLPDRFTVSLILLGLAAAYWFDRANWIDHWLGVVAGFAVFALLSVLYRKLRGREGLGLGDAKLLAGIGAWVSWEGLATVIFLGAVVALAIVLARALMNRRLDIRVRIAFGPFLAIGGWLVWLYGPLVPI